MSAEVVKLELPDGSDPLRSLARLTVLRLTGEFSGYEPPAPRRGPAAGEHNADFYAELAIDEEEPARLSQAGVV
ncbi:hypothetical protein LMG23992_04543 [Cupriavidus laharis]|uniref:Uncharacterized protein n=1 Tax=Cupriavidus laharis TaxID=151654 RepID=A0ABN7Z6M6_9BURK|nr:hypothetical protein [Cupriavidus laharis]CAG9181622.1 hypothetical protein LMG23992_04543 [Cupriavidus laharis]